MLRKRTCTVKVVISKRLWPHNVDVRMEHGGWGMENALIQSLAMASFYPATSVTRPPPTTKTGSCMYALAVKTSTTRICGEYLANDAKLRHGVDDAQKGGNRFRLFPDLRLVHLDLEVVVLEVLLDLCSIYIVYVQIGHGQHSTPALVTRRQLGILGVEDSIEEGEIVRNLLVALDVESVLRRKHRSFHVRHVESTGAIGEKESLGSWAKSRRILGGKPGGAQTCYIVSTAASSTS